MGLENMKFLVCTSGSTGLEQMGKADPNSHVSGVYVTDVARLFGYLCVGSVGAAVCSH